MKKKWGPLIGGLLIGIVIFTMSFKHVVHSIDVSDRNNIIYENSIDTPLSGTLEIYYENSDTLKSSITYIKGIPYGKYILYYRNGEISEKGHYKKGALHGKYSVYYENGKIREKGHYKHGKLDGKIKFYDENGKKIRVLEYDEGSLVNEN